MQPRQLRATEFSTSGGRGLKPLIQRLIHQIHQTPLSAPRATEPSCYISVTSRLIHHRYSTDTSRYSSRDVTPELCNQPCMSKATPRVGGRDSVLNNIGGACRGRGGAGAHDAARPKHEGTAAYGGARLYSKPSQGSESAAV